MEMEYRVYSKLYPRKLRESYFRILGYTNLKVQPDKFIGFVFLMGLGFGLLFAFNTAIFIKLPVVVLWLIGFLTFETCTYVWLMLKIDAKAKAIEKVLPDVLQLMSSNLKAGLTIDAALMQAARPEFGLFQFELNRVGQEITIGKEVGSALLDMTTRIASEKLKKSMLLIVQGLKAGGKLSELLDQTARNLRNKESLDEKIRSNVMSYVIFIFASVSFGTPLLFGLSSFLIEILKKIIAQVEIPDSATANVPINITPVSIDPHFIVVYSIVSIMMSSIMGSLVMGLIMKGKEKYGFRYIPILLLVTISIFFLIRKGLDLMLGGLFTF